MSVVTDPMVFDNIVLAEVPVKIGGVSYVLREATVDIVAKYRKMIHFFLSRRDSGSLTKEEGLPDTDPYLVSLCLFADTPEGRKAVSLDFVKGLPSHIFEALLDRVKIMSDVDTDSLESLKKQRVLLDKRIAAMEERERNLKNL